MKGKPMKNSVQISKYFQCAIVGSLACLGLTVGSVASASQLIYTPVNPSFGGNPLNGSYLLSKAQATNTHTASGSSADLGSASDETPLQQFNDQLQSSILSRVAASATSSILGADGTLKPGIVQTSNFTISVVDAGGGLLNITTTDKTTGATTTFQVSQ